MLSLKIIQPVFLFFILFPSIAFSQNIPADSTDEEEVDTVIINQPVTIKEFIYVLEKKQNFPWSLEAGVAGFYSFNHYAICPGFENYFQEYNYSTRDLLGKSFSVNFSYLSTKLYFTTGIAYTIFREKFEYLNNSNKNTFSYGDLSIGIGYRFYKRKVSYILSNSVVFSNLISYKGKTLDETPEYQIDDINYVRGYTKFIASINPAFRMLYHKSEKISYIFELFYRGELMSATKTLEPFIQQRNLVGIKTGVLYNFR